MDPGAPRARNGGRGDRAGFGRASLRERGGPPREARGSAAVEVGVVAHLIGSRRAATESRSDRGGKKAEVGPLFRGFLFGAGTWRDALLRLRTVCGFYAPARHGRVHRAGCAVCVAVEKAR